MKAVEQGLKGEAAAHTRALLASRDPLDLVDHALIPALDAVGAGVREGHAVPAPAAAVGQRRPGCL